MGWGGWRLLDAHQRTTLRDRLFRGIGNLDDHSLIQLEARTRAAESGAGLTLPAPSGKNRPDSDSVSRRYFLAALVGGGVLAASAGGAGGVGLNEEGVWQWVRQEGWMATPNALASRGTTRPNT